MAKSIKHVNKTPTEGLLKKSLLFLIQTKPIGSITVKELCAHAGINRTTFYAHYSSVQEILESIQNELIDELTKIIRTITQTEHSVKEGNVLFLTEIKKRKDIYNILFSIPDCVSFIQQFAALLHSGIASKSMPYSNTANSKYYPIYMTSGAVACITKWVAADCDIPVEEFATLLLTLAHDSNLSR